MASFHKTHNPVCEVHFAGFRSTTLELQNNGWQLAYEDECSRHAVRLVLRHEGARLYALTNAVDYSQMLSMHDARALPAFHVKQVMTRGEFIVMPATQPVAFKAFDATPSFEEMRTERISFEDAFPFRPLNPNAQEIVLVKESVPELMELILKLQDPRQKEIRDNRRKEAWRQDGRAAMGYNPQADILAQVISIAG